MERLCHCLLAIWTDRRVGVIGDDQGVGHSDRSQGTIYLWKHNDSTRVTRESLSRFVLQVNIAEQLPLLKAQVRDILGLTMISLAPHRWLAFGGSGRGQPSRWVQGVESGLLCGHINIRFLILPTTRNFPH